MNPTDLTVTAGDTKLDLSWTAPAGTVTGYDVHYTSASARRANDDAAVQTGQTPSAGDGWVDAGHSGTAASHSLTGLTADKTYRVRVRAKNAAGHSGWLTGTRALQEADTAPSGNVLVSNVLQTDAVRYSMKTSTRAQCFTTGSTVGGYGVGSVELDLARGRTLSKVQRGQIDVELWSATTDGSPSQLFRQLITPSRVAAGNVEFAAPAGTTLDASTTYCVVFRSTSLDGIDWAGTSSADEDAGGAAGWSIADGRLFSAPGGVWLESLGALQIRVNIIAQVDTTAPAAPTFSPENGAAVRDASTNITITFDEALRKDANGTALANEDLAAILTLKVDNDAGNAIGFAASIDSDKKVITLDPTNDLAEGTVYVAISAEHWDAAGNKGSQRTATFTVDLTAPAAPTFSPASAATVTDATTDITITFEEALTKNSSAEALENADLAAILTLKVGDDTGDPIDFSATIDQARKVITLDPAADLPDGKVYVAISADHFDAAGNQGSQRTATFTVDTAAPTVTIGGVPEAINATTAFTATFTFSEEVTGFVTGDVTVTGGSKGTFSGSAKSYSLVVTPTGSQDVVVTVAQNAASDGASQQGPAAAVTATATWDTAAPAAPTFSPENGAAVRDASTNITITFDEALRKDANGTALANEDLAAILTLKVDNDAGNAIGFAASIDSDKKVITLDPTNDLAEGTVYVAISAEHWDAAGNKGSQRTATFTVDLTAPAAPTFSPASAATVTDATTDITISFEEALRKDASGTALNNADLAAILELKVGDENGGAIDFSATIDQARKVITLDPAGNLPDGKVYVAISDQHWDAAGNQGAQRTATFTVDTAAPTVTIGGVPEAINATTAFTATFTFSEEVTGFVTGDVTVTGGSKGTFSGSAKSYSLVVTPTGSQDVVVTVAQNAASDGASQQGPAAAVTATATWDTAAPAAPTFSPENGAAVRDASTNITITFDEALRKDANGTALANEDLAAILTLKVDNDAGNAIGFAASIDSDKKVITLDPTNDLAEGTVYVAISAEHWDAAGNKGSQRTATFTVDLTAPAAPTFSPASAATVTDATTDITISFEEALRKDASGTALNNADLAAILELKVGDENGGAIDFSATIDQARKVITLDPAGNLPDGKVYVAISDQHWDAAGNQGAQHTATFTVDTAAPTVTIGGVPEAINATTAFTATFTFSEEVTGFVTGDVTVTGGSKGTFSGSAKSYSLVVTPTGSQDVVVTVAQNAASDGASQQGPAAAVTATATWDTAAPAAPTFSPENGAAVRDASTNITITFDEALRKDANGTALANEDLAAILTLKVDNDAGNAIGFAASIDSDKKVITLDPTNDLAEGTVYVAISAEHWDAAGNKGSQRTATFTVDLTAPAAPTFSPASAATVTDATTDITISFEEALRKDASGTALNNADLAAILELKVGDENGGAIDFSATIDQARKVITLDPAGNLPDGKVYVAISDQHWDAAGNQGAQHTATFTVDTAAPTVTIGGVPEAINATTAFTATFTFSEEVTGFVTGDVTVTGGSKGTFSGSAKSYSLVVTPTGSQDVVVTVAQNAASDGASQQGPAAAVTATATWDTAAPAAPTFSPENGAAVRDASTNITITFDEALRKDANGTALANEDLAAILTLKVDNDAGNAIGFAASIDSDKKVITLDPTNDLAEGTVYVAISAEHWDAAGNKGSQRTATFTVDLTAPAAPTFSPASAATVTDATTDITISFEEALRKDASGTALNNADLAAILELKVGDENGGAIDFSATIDQARKVITLDPAGNLPDGKVYVAISDQHWDAAGNQGAQHTATFTVDTAAPTVTIGGVPEAINATTAFTATFTFSEEVTGFVTGDVTVTGGSKGTFSGSAKSYSLVVTPTGSQDVVVTVAQNAASDGASQQGPAAAVTATATWDTAAPAAPTFSPENGAAVRDASTNITITFDEALRKDANGTALANEDLAAILTLKVDNDAGNAIGFAASIDSDKKVITLDPTNDLAEGTVYVAISAEHWDAAGNKGSQRTATFTVDLTAPAAPTFSPASAATVSDATTDITISFEEALRKDASGTALNNADLAAILELKVGDENGGAIDFSATIDQARKVITLNPAGNLPDGKVYVAISDQHWDAAGNQGAQHTATFTVDTAAPTVTIGGVPEAINATTAFTATFTFSEEVTGFVTGDVTVTGGSKGTFSGSAKSYSLVVTPTGSQDVVVTVAQNAASDGASQQGPAAAVTATATWDTAAPAAPTFSPENGAAVRDASTNITITFDEALRKDANGTALANEDLAAILTLKVDNDAGNAIGFAASIDSDKKVITLDPTNDLAEGTVYVAISAEHWDAAGNKGSQRTATFTVDLTAPAAPTFSPASAATVTDATTDITISFEEALRKDASGTALNNADLAAILELKVGDENGGAIDFSATIDQARKVITLNPAGNLPDGKVYVAISDQHWDAAGNQGAQHTATFTVDTAAPTVTIGGVPEAINATTAFTATFTFSEEVTGFVTGDVTVTGGSKGTFSGSAKSYSLVVTPTGSQDVVVTVAQNAASDGASQQGPAAAVTATATWDTAAPAAPTFSPENGAAVRDASTNITITFDEALRKDANGTALANEDLAAILTLKVDNDAGNAIGFAASIDSDKKVITLDPTNDLAEGTVYVAISAEHWDAAGNKGSQRTATFTVDLTAPAAPTFSPASAATVTDATTDITISFEEALRKDASGTALNNADLAAILELKVGDENGGAIDFSATIDQARKVITLDPAGNLPDGKVYVAISDQHWDAAGNQGAQHTATFTVDTAAPTVTIGGVPEAINATTAFTATFTFSEEVTGFVTGDVTVTGGSKGTFSGSAKSYSLVVTPTGSQDVVVTVAQNAASDGASQQGPAAAVTATATWDTAAPAAPTFSPENGAAVRDASTNITITFDEALRKDANGTALANEDLAAILTLKVDNDAGNAIGFAASIDSDKKVITLDPTNDLAEGTVYVAISAEHWDAAGNKGSQRTATFTVDLTAPAAPTFSPASAATVTDATTDITISFEEALRKDASGTALNNADLAAILELKVGDENGGAIDFSATIDQARKVITLDPAGNLPDGKVYVAISDQHWDAAGNQGAQHTATFTVDTAAPTVTIGGVPEAINATTAFTATFTFSEEVTGFVTGDVTVTGGSKGTFSGSAKSYSLVVTPTGSQDVVVTVAQNAASDGASQQGPAAAVTATATWDTAAPAAPTFSPENGAAVRDASTNITITFDEALRKDANGTALANEDLAAILTLKVDNDAGNAIGFAASIDSDKKVITLDPTNDLAEGTVYVAISAEHWDAAGNKGSQRTATFTVDLTAPAAPTFSPASAATVTDATTDITISFEEALRKDASGTALNNADLAAILELKVGDENGGAIDFSATIDQARKVITLDPAGNLPDGKVYVAISDQHWDAAGNQGAQHTATFTVDTAAPTVTIGGVPEAINATTAFTATFTFSEEVTGFVTGDVTVTGGSKGTFSGSAKSYSLVVTPTGSQDVVVTVAQNAASDGASQQGPAAAVTATATWDTAAPAAPTFSPENGAAVRDASTNITITFDEALRKDANGTALANEDLAAILTLKVDNDAGNAIGFAASIDSDKKVITLDPTNDLAEGTVYVAISAEHWDAAGNKGSQRTATFTVDLTAPAAPTFSPASAATVTDATTDITISFEEALRKDASGTALNNADLAAILELKVGDENGGAIDFSATIDQARKVITLDPAGNLPDGKVYVAISDQHWDAAGNQGAQHTATFTVDTAAPTVTIGGVPEAINATTAFTATFTFSEEVTGFVTGDVTVTGGSKGTFSGSAKSYSLVVTPTGSQDVVVTVAQNAASDGASQQGPAAAVTATATWDTAAPAAPTFSPENGAAVRDASTNITITFDEALRKDANGTALANEDLAAILTLKVDNDAGNAIGFAASIDSDKKVITLDPTNDLAEGTVYVAISAEHWDAAGNKGSQRTATFTVDLTAPAAPTFSPASAATVTDATTDITISFEEALRKDASGTALNNADLAAILELKVGDENGGAIDFSATIDQARKVITLDPAGNLPDGKVYVAISDQHWDAAGNQGAQHTATFTVDTAAPTVTIGGVPEAINATTAFTATFTFSEEVTGFVTGDVTVTGGSKGTFSGSAKSYSLVVTPTGSQDVVVTVAQNAASDGASQQGPAAAVTATATWDTAAPAAPTFSPENGAAVRDASTNITITFDEALRKDANGTALANEDLAAILTLKVDNDAGNAIGFAASIDSDKKVITLDPTNDLAEGTVYVAISAEHWDAAGNKGSQRTATFTVDLTAPAAPTFSPASAATVTDATTDITISFEEALRKDASGTALNNADLAAILELKVGDENGGAIDFSATIDQARKVITLDPAGNLPDGKVYVAISDQHWDAAGNQGSQRTATFTVDTAAPTVTIGGVPEAINATTAFTATFTFSEEVTGFVTGDVTVTGGSKGTFSGSAKSYSLVVTPTGSQDVVVTVAQNAASDGASQQGPAAAVTATATWDTAAPAAPTFSPENGAAVRDASTNITITFDEALRKDANGTALANEDLAAILTLKVDNDAGNAIGFAASIDSDKKVITLDPTNDLAEGTVYVAISAEHWDAAGNKGSQRTATFTVDLTAPAAPTFSPASAATVTDATTDITISFEEALRKDASGTALNNADLAAILELKVGDENGGAIDFSATIDQARKVITLDPAGNLPDGKVYVAISDQHWDAAGNQGAQHTATFTVDTAAPTVTIGGVPEAINATTAFTATFTFSEEVTGFVTGDVTVTGGSKGTFSGSAKSYSLVVTPTGSQDVVVTVAQNAASDGASQQGPAAAVTATATWDTAAPAAPTFSPENGAAVRDASTNITITFDEALRKDANGTALANEDLAAILTLKVDNDAGNAIGFAASIDSDKKVITLDPTNDLAEGTVYVAISAEHWDAAGNKGSQRTATFTVDLTAPAAPTFSPASAATVTDATTDITISFEEALRKDASGTALNNADLAAILELKVGDENGGAIDFSATIDQARKVITLDPAGNLPDGKVYVAISDQHWDAAGNQGAQHTATFTVDTAAPTVTIGGVPEAINATTAFTATFTFSEEVTGFVTGDVTVTGGSKGTFSGSAKSYSLVVTPGGAGDVVVTVRANAASDGASQQGPAAAVTATATWDTAAPAAPTFSPENGAAVRDASTNITITFDEALRKDANGTALANEDLAAILTLKVDNDAGNAIGFAASIDSDKKVITLDPTNDLAEGTVYVAISAEHWDAAGNKGSQRTATFTVDLTAPAAPTFSPASAATVTDATTDITISFEEALRKDASGTALNNADLAAILELKVGDENGGAIDFSATIDQARKVITLDPAGNLPDGKVYVAISDQHWDAAGNQGAQHTATFTVDTAAPTVTIGGVPEAINATTAFTATFTFSEEVTGFVTGDVTVTGGSKGTFSGSAKSYSLVVTPTGSQDVVVTVAQNAASDGASQQGPAAAVTATATWDTAAPAAPTFSPENGDAVRDASTNITITFNEALRRDGDGAAFTSEAHLKAILTLKTTNSSGTPIPYAASIDDAKKVITLDPTSDLAEGTVYVAISAEHWDAAGNKGSAHTATFTVEGRGISVSPKTLTLHEADDTSTEDTAENKKTYTVGLDSQPTGTVTIAVASGDTKVATVSPATLTFTAQSYAAQTVTVTAVPDALDNAGDKRTATITHTVTATGTDYAAVTAESVTVEVADDDTAPSGAITLAASPDSLAEAANATSVTVTATLPGSVARDTDTAITVAVGKTTDAATEGTDYATVNDFTLTVDAGKLTGTKTFSLDPTQDTIDEGTGETLSVSGTTAVSGLTVGSDQITITDDDAAPTAVTLTANPDSVAENGGARMVTVTAAVGGTTRFGAAKTVAVTVGKTGDTAVSGTDYAAVTGFSVEIAAGADSGAKTFTLTPTDDSLDESEETLSVEGTLSGVTVTGDTIAITDDDGTASTVATLGALAASTSTSAGETFTSLTLSPAFSSSTTAYTATVAETRSHAKVTPTASDSGATVKVGKKGTTLAEVTSGSASSAITLDVGSNEISVEVTAADETTSMTYAVTVTRLWTTLSVSLGDGSLGLAWTAPSGTVEGYEVHYTSAPKTGEESVADNAAVQTDAQATAAAGWLDASHSGTEASHTISSLSNGTAYRVRVRAKGPGGNSGWVTGDGTPVELPAVQFTETSYEILEGRAAVITLTASIAPKADIALGIGYASGSATPASSAGDCQVGWDHGMIPSSVTLPEGDTELEISVTSCDDDLFEDERTSESFTLTIEPGSGYTVAERASTTVSIRDDDTGFAPPGKPVLEAVTSGDGAPTKTTLSFNVSCVSQRSGSGPVTGYVLNAVARDDPSLVHEQFFPSEQCGTGGPMTLTGLPLRPVATTYAVTAIARALRGGNGLASEPVEQATLADTPQQDAAPLTASFEGVPSEHRGHGTFSFTVNFSVSLDGGQTPTPRSFEISEGAIMDLVKVSAKKWTVHVRPTTWRAVGVLLRGGRSCDEPNAVCASGVRALSNSPSATVGESARFSVSGDFVREGPDEQLTFRVSLNRAVSHEVRVNYATRDGRGRFGGNAPATAGEDYTAVSNTLVFEPGEQEKRVNVTILDDSVDEGGEYFLLVLSNPQGAYLSFRDEETPGLILNSDPVPGAWLSRFGRTVAEQHVTAVRDRLAADRAPGFSGRFAGQPLPEAGTRPGLPPPGTLAARTDSPAAAWPESTSGGPQRGARALAFAEPDGGQARTPPAVPEFTEEERLAFLALLAAAHGPEDGEKELEDRTLTADDVLFGTSFTMARDSGTGLSYGFWGNAVRSGFSGQESGGGGDAGALSLDGEVTGVLFGADWKRKDRLVGVMLSQSQGTGTYSGASSGGLDVRLTSVVPYAGMDLGGHPFWGVAGLGFGDLTLTPEGGSPASAGIAWRMAAAGTEGVLASGEWLGGAHLGWHADALWTRTTSQSATGIAASFGETTRLRLGLRAAWERTLASGATLRTDLETGLRHDGGDAETGYGLEIGGGLGFSDPARGLAISLDGRTLALHEDGAFGNWGLGLNLAWDPAPGTKRGWSARVSHGLGGSSSGGVDALLGPETFPGLAEAGGEGSWSLEGAYGRGRSHGMVGSPYGQMSGTGEIESLRLGYRIEPDGSHAADITVNAWTDPAADGGSVGAGIEWKW